MDTAFLAPLHSPPLLNSEVAEEAKEGEVERRGDWGKLSLQLISYLARRKRKLLSRLGVVLALLLRPAFSTCCWQLWHTAVHVLRKGGASHTIECI